MKLTAEEKQGLSPAEIAALEGEGADEALATMGDEAPAPRGAAATHHDDDDAATGAAADNQDGANADTDADDGGQAAAAEATKGKPDAADDGALTAEQLAEIAADTGTASAAEPAKLPTFEVPERDFAAERKALRDSRTAIQAKWDEGALTDEELRAQLDEVDDKLEALAAERARADTLRSINEQAAKDAQAKVEAEFNTATAAIIKAAATSTTAKVDYLKDKGAQRQFDMALDMLQADEANAGKTPTQLVKEAHRAVLVVRGLPVDAPKPAAAPAAAAAPAEPAPPKPRDVPMTLGGLPNASQVPMEDETLAQASRLNGEELEAYLARLSPAQQKKLMATVDRQSGAVH